MKVECFLELNFDSNEHAKQIFGSVHIDDATFMDSMRKESRILTTINTSTIASMLHTVDDYLSCVKIAENIIEKKK